MADENEGGLVVDDERVAGILIRMSEESKQQMEEFTNAFGEGGLVVTQEEADRLLKLGAEGCARMRGIQPEKEWINLEDAETIIRKALWDDFVDGTNEHIKSIPLELREEFKKENT